ncbi:sugar transferase [Saccharopolyspora mangrovi]|uniref:Sugar transferase n=1 Tax=Saccharopolyspora mangrovi TaxID=3082379 RepID=A0ABU6AHK7_9PSEU|nr:sugar transferase [Saccharopolyspora sp. S2-29]MEB3371000.1 sugar transferase [Saccharopolyspora sp. S2-29]
MTAETAEAVMVSDGLRGVHAAKSSGSGRFPVVVVEDEGTGSRGERLDEELQVIARLPVQEDWSGLHVVLALGRPKLVLVKARLDRLDYRLLSLCASHRVDVLALAEPGYGLLGSGRLRRLGGLPWLRLRWPQKRAGMRVKRAVDILLVLFAAPVLLPLLVVLCAVVCWDGPPLYVQERVGQRGRPFRLIKIRTMRVGIERITGPTLTSSGGSGVTAIGRVLRRYRLDELPQLWNVLRGEMSLVGPRPERPEFVQDFVRRLPMYDLRHGVRPGITGIAQLTNGYEATVDDKLRCDLLYVSSLSLPLDLKLLALTVIDLLRGFPRG